MKQEVETTLPVFCRFLYTVINKYEELIRSYKENIDRFESFECNDFFKGRDLAEHNRRILGRRRIKYESRKNFLH